VVTDAPAKAELERQDLLRKTTVKAKARATTKQKTSKKQPKFNISISGDCFVLLVAVYVTATEHAASVPELVTDVISTPELEAQASSDNSSASASSVVQPPKPLKTNMFYHNCKRQHEESHLQAPSRSEASHKHRRPSRYNDFDVE